MSPHVVKWFSYYAHILVDFVVPMISKDTKFKIDVIASEIIDYFEQWKFCFDKYVNLVNSVVFYTYLIKISDSHVTISTNHEMAPYCCHYPFGNYLADDAYN